MSEIKQNKFPKTKITYFISLLLLFLFSCGKKVPKTPDEKAKKLIAELFEAPKNGTYHYEAGQFGKLDSAFTTYHDDSLYKAYSDTVSFYFDKATVALGKLQDIGYITDTTQNKAEKEKLWKELIAASDVHISYLDSASLYSERSKGIKEKYKPHFKGWKMTHNYKANNAFEVPVEQKTTFYFDTPFNKDHRT
jgi:hypothetical protein